METKQLYEKVGNEFKPINPSVSLDELIDKETDLTLGEILVKYNHLRVNWKGDVATTRKEVPVKYRHNGLYITYNNGTDLVTEYYVGNNNSITTETWTNNVNWKTPITEDWINANMSKLKPAKDSVGYEQLTPALRQLVNQNTNVSNYPDDEDLTSQDNLLKFKNREYNPNEFSGKGYVILRKNLKKVNGVTKNILEQSMINKENTIYEIRYDFNLNGEEITVPKGCTLKFEGGMLRNGTVRGLLLLAGRLNKVFDCIKVVDSDTQGFVPVNAFVNLKDTFSNFRCVEINEDIKIDGDIYLDSWQEVRGHNTNLSLNGTIFLGHSCKVGGLNINQRSSADIPTLCVALSHLNKTYINNKYDKIFRDNKWFSNLTIEDLALTSSNSLYVGKGIEFVNDGCDVGFWGASIRNIRVFGTFKNAITIENSLDSPVGWFTDLNFENIKISQSYIGVYITGKKLYGFIFDKISMQMTKTTSCMFKLEGGSGNITNIIPWDYPESTNPVYVINPNYIGEYSLDVADNHTETGVIYEMSEEIKSNRILSFNFNFKNLENGLDVSQVHLFQNMDESVRFTYKDFLTLPSNNITCSDKDTSIVILKKLGLFDSLSLRSYDTLRLFFTVNRAYDSKVINLYVFNDITHFVYNFVTVTTSSFHNAYNAIFQPAYNMLPDIGDINNKNDINGAILDNTIFLNKGNICIKKDGNILDAKGYNVLYEGDIIDKTELLSIMLQKSENFKNQKYGYKFTYHSYENEDMMYLQLMKSSLGFVVDVNGFGVAYLDPSFSIDEVNQIFRNAKNRTRGIVLYGVYDFNEQTISANGMQYILLGENCNMNNGRIICNGSIVKSKTILKTNLIFQGANYVDRSVYHIPSYVSRIEELDNHCDKESFGEFALDRKTSRTFFKNGQLWVDALGRPYNKSIIGATSQRPTGVSEGFEFYDTTLKKKILWNGSKWVNVDGSELV